MSRITASFIFAFFASDGTGGRLHGQKSPRKRTKSVKYLDTAHTVTAAKTMAGTLARGRPSLLLFKKNSRAGDGAGGLAPDFLLADCRQRVHTGEGQGEHAELRGSYGGYECRH